MNEEIRLQTLTDSQVGEEGGGVEGKEKGGSGMYLSHK